jgi:chromosome segregation ATPase
MTAITPEWNELKRIADELELKIHLASMDLRDRWQALRPRIAELEQTISRTGERASKVVTEELAAIGKALHQLRDEITRPG